MSETLVVDLNEEGMHSVRVPEAFTAAGSFEVLLRNHGSATRVHLSLDDALAGVATVDASHHYVTEGDTERATVEVAPDAATRGRLTVAVAYGATTADVSVEVEPTVSEKPPVEVDESLSEPADGNERPTESLAAVTRGASGGDTTTVPAVALGGVAVALAAATVTTDGAVAVVLAVLAVVAALAGAGYVVYARP
ncbi:DUF7524 family protein [Halomarina ordinaria]|uniref:PGF-pre-PGF domain-containing protein n=1 Tax=Halomarina ordinaria TaxID=3033939 RepID=A0ABD5UB28_9EURY|nr:hypothetical protein [Halomarina sp. PSRA2]